MSVAEIDVIMKRIRAATPSSTIAVFDCGSSTTADAVFGETVMTRRRLNIGDVTLIGIYHGKMDLDAVKKEILGRLGTG